ADVFGMLLDLADVMAREEGAPLARDDGAADIEVGVEFAQHVAEVGPGLDRHGIELVRVVQDDPGDVAVLAGLDHASSSLGLGKGERWFGNRKSLRPRRRS